MFITIPISNAYEKFLNYSNEFLNGLATGSYGVAQAIFQIPIGIISDKFNKKKIILFCLIIFIIGSMIPIFINSIYGIIICRLLQGSCAISSIIINLITEQTSKKNKIKTMILIGMIFPISFFISFILSPIILNSLNLKGMFLIISITSIFCLILTIKTIPNKQNLIQKKISYKKNIFKTLSNKKLRKLNFHIFFLHSLLTGNFTVIPKIIVNTNFPIGQHWKIYLGTLSITFLIFSTSIIKFFQKKKKIKQFFIFLILNILISEIILLFSKKNFWMIIISIQLFFISFIFQEAILPSFVSKESKSYFRGTAMSIYGTSKFLGIAFGGIIGGYILKKYKDIYSVILFEILLCIFWIINAFKTKSFYKKINK